MLGHEGVSLAVVEALADRLPTKTAQLRDRLDLAGEELPDVVSIVAHEPEQVGIEHWPMVVVTAVSDRDWRPIEADPAVPGPRYRVAYQVRATMWTRGDSYTDTTATQHRIHLAVTEALLWPLDLAPGIRLEDTSLASSMSDVATTDTGRTIAGSRLDFTVVVEEHVPVPAIVGVDRIADFDTSIIPPVTP